MLNISEDEELFIVYFISIDQMYLLGSLMACLTGEQKTKVVSQMKKTRLQSIKLKKRHREYKHFSHCLKFAPKMIILYNSCLHSRSNSEFTMKFHSIFRYTVL